MFGAVDGLLERAVADGVIPGVSVCIRKGDADLHVRSFGLAEIRPAERVASNETVWDLASLTKVLATTPIMMTMVHRGEVSLETRVCDLLPEVAEGITVGHLLSHCAGIPAWKAFVDVVSLEAAGGEETRERILLDASRVNLEAVPGSRHLYSDIGFLILARVIETVTGLSLKQAYRERVGVPSGVQLHWGHPDAAATEDCPQRQRVVRGEVHDLNAWLMGGVSTHAGLFGTATDVAASAAWQLRAFNGATAEGLDPAVVRRFMETQGAGSHRMGWDGVSPGGSAGPLWPRSGIGHLAFTGCSIWMAPTERIVVALLSNRVHPVIEGGAVPNAPIHPRYVAFRELRQSVHSAIAEAVGLASSAARG